ncbi:hypothetical protein AK812_SmicGene5107 [Symbiodinium microadriaticum]|uniref:Uncharacterized protein n=1 Tax=Symbiodinium microadriaticum TaxID=2951 RepID=A0A1Q9EUK7_SYMMI|nr:hypothetical protein AK812_SmicGene5107 [Symbiodinium microadriaticum]
MLSASPCVLSAAEVADGGPPARPSSPEVASPDIEVHRQCQPDPLLARKVDMFASVFFAAEVDENADEVDEWVHARLLKMNNIFWVTCARAIYTDQETPSSGDVIVEHVVQNIRVWQAGVLIAPFGADPLQTIQIYTANTGHFTSGSRTVQFYTASSGGFTSGSRTIQINTGHFTSGSRTIQFYTASRGGFTSGSRTIQIYSARRGHFTSGSRTAQVYHRLPTSRTIQIYVANTGCFTSAPRTSVLIYKAVTGHCKHRWRTYFTYLALHLWAWDASDLVREQLRSHSKLLTWPNPAATGVREVYRLLVQKPDTVCQYTDDPMLQPFMDMMLAKWGAAAGDSGGENDDDEVERPDDDDEANLAEGNFGVEWDEAGHQVALLDPYPSFISSPVPTPSPAPICDAGPNSNTATSSDEKASSPAKAPAKKEHVFECQLVRKPAFTSLLTVASPQNAAQKAGPTVEERLARLSELRKKISERRLAKAAASAVQHAAPLNSIDPSQVETQLEDADYCVDVAMGNVTEAASMEDAAPPTASEDAAPPTASEEAAPPTASMEDAAPPTASTKEAAPPTASEDAAPRTASTKEAAPPTASTKEAAPPAASTEEAAPPTASPDEPEVVPPPGADSSVLDYKGQLFRSDQFEAAVEVGRGRGRGARGPGRPSKGGCAKKGEAKTGRGRGRGRGRGKAAAHNIDIVTPPKKAAHMDADCSAPKAERPTKKPAAAKCKAVAPAVPTETAGTNKRKAATAKTVCASKGKAATPKTPEKKLPKSKASNKKPKPTEDVPAEGVKQKAFARRWCPTSEPASSQWVALRDVYDVEVRPHITKCPGKKEESASLEDYMRIAREKASQFVRDSEF